VGAQSVSNFRARVAATLLIDPGQVHVQSPFVGGAFGSKVAAHAEVILASLATRQLQTPVKVAMTRQQVFQLVGNRAATRQRVRLGARSDGALVAIAHEADVAASPLLNYPEHAAVATRTMYAAPNRLTRHRVVQLDIEPPDDLRAPGESTGQLAPESAMDELAHALGVDPVELRIRNEPTVDPERGVPFSQRRLVECMQDGARRFGWERRVSTPGTVRDGRSLLGLGMAAGIRMHLQGALTAAVRMAPDRTVTVLTDTDLGTGTYTTLAQVAADALEIPLGHVRVALGSSDLPLGGGSNASWGAASSSNAVHAACEALREKLREKEGRIPPEGLEATGSIGGLFDDPNHQAYSIHSYAAHFAEVGVGVDWRGTAAPHARRV
jgi:xanthine dehydrogenase YagR molybdenum-binding subunit